MGNITRTCKAGSRCHWPNGPEQPLHHFQYTDSKSRTRKRVYCASCRAHKSRNNRRSYQRRAGPPLPSIADIPAERQAELNRWLIGLVIRRDGHPLTRDISATARKRQAPSDYPPRTCTRRDCRQVHNTRYKLCPGCRKITRDNARARRAALGAV
jgi:hypothetical protein